MFKSHCIDVIQVALPTAPDPIARLGLTQNETSGPTRIFTVASLRGERIKGMQIVTWRILGLVHKDGGFCKVIRPDMYIACTANLGLSGRF